MLHHIAVDFDDTLTEIRPQRGILEPQPPKPGALEWLRQLAQLGHTVTIFTARTELEPVHAWLQHYGVRQYVAGVTNVKLPTFTMIVDDRAVALHDGWPDPVVFGRSRRDWLRREAGRRALGE